MPWWRASYDDGTWEDLTKTQVLQGINMHKVADVRIDDAGNFIDAASTAYPTDFSSAYINKRIRLAFNTGWKAGRITKAMHTKNFNYEVQFDDEPGPRDASLVRETYSAQANAAHGSWYLIK